MKLPKSINPCPIIEAIFEVRFEPLVPRSAVFGIIFNQIKDEFITAPESLPILNIPEQLRENDPGLKHKPHYKISKENIVIQIGPDVFSINMVNKYTGWNSFSKEIYAFLNKIAGTKIMGNVHRIGLRYVNFFEAKIFESINIDVHLNNKQIDYDNTVLRTAFTHENFMSNLLVSNQAKVNDKIGSIIDIDTHIDIDSKLKEFIYQKENFIEEAHKEEKNLFYKLLREEFLEKFNPKY